MTVLLEAPVIEGAVVDAEPIVSGVECSGEIIEGARLEAEALAD